MRYFVQSHLSHQCHSSDQAATHTRLSHKTCQSTQCQCQCAKAIHKTYQHFTASIISSQNQKMHWTLVLCLTTLIVAAKSADTAITPSQLLHLSLVPQSTDDTGYVTVALSSDPHETPYTVCSDNLSLLEANIMCQQMNRGIAHTIVRYPIKTPLTKPLIFLYPSRCYGSETNLRQCLKTNELKPPTQCESKSILGVRCVRALPNVTPDVESLEKSVYLHTEPIYHLVCAMEESCLSPEAMKKYGNSTQEQLYSINDDNQLLRKLLRFSSIVRNRGEAAFLPYLSNGSWQWHSCHGHYHSMAVFAVYQIFTLSTDSIDDKKGLLITGHKASFCLEDNVCVDGVKPYFKCSRNKSTTGNQGISPGCSDTYLHDIDCQWIDVTSLPYGRYIFRMVVNPQFLVGESNYHDNAIACELYYFGHYIGLHYCHLTHPLTFW